MKKTKTLGIFWFFLAPFVGLLLISCNKQEGQPLSDFAQEIAMPADNLTEDEVTAQALSVYNVLFSESLRSAGTPEVLSVQKTSSLRTSSEAEGNAGVFVVNFKDDRGYVVLSESKFNEPIISASERGNLDIALATENMNLIPVLYNTDAILEHNHHRKMLTDLTTVDDVPLPDISQFEKYRYEFGEWETVAQAGPLVQVAWGQRDPHNRKLEKINGQLPPVGCVATAVSQIMSYHRYPQYNWDKILSDMFDPYSVDVLSTLHRDLGKPENLDMHYSLDNSGAYSANVPRTLRAYGYQSSDLCDYNFATIKSEIFAQRPVYIRANSFKHVTKTPRFLFWGGKTKVSYSGGHAWVLDGFKGLRRKISKIDRLTNEVVDVSYQTKELVHCNFGWNGSDNGYYLSKAFNKVNGPEMRSTEEGETYGQKYNYQYNHQIIKDIKRR